jgi:hypothetical protein
MDKEYYDKIISLYENNQKIKDLLEKEIEEIGTLIKLESLDEQSRENFIILQKSMEKHKEHKSNLDGLYTSLNQKPTVTFGIMYPHKKENLYVYLLQTFKDLSTFYEEDIILFTIEDLDLEKMTVAGTIISGSTLKQGVATIPPFIYNLTFHSKKSSLKKMKQLRKLGICKTINPINTFNQTILLDILSSLPEMKSFIQPYDLFSPSTLENYLKQNDFILLIPENEVNRSSMIHVSRSLDENEYYLAFNGIKVICSYASIYNEIKRRMKEQSYLIMEGLPALLWMNTPLESRVYLQKTIHGKWEITDIIGKSEFLTSETYQKNICEQLPWLLKKIMPNKAPSVLDTLSDISIKAGNYLDYFIPNLGTLTIDFLLDENGNPYLFHIKGWENKNFLREASKDNWDTFLQNSFHYLFFLFQNSRLDRDAK